MQWLTYADECGIGRKSKQWRIMMQMENDQDDQDMEAEEFMIDHTYRLAEMGLIELSPEEMEMKRKNDEMRDAFEEEIRKRSEERRKRRDWVKDNMPDDFSYCMIRHPLGAIEFNKDEKRLAVFTRDQRGDAMKFHEGYYSEMDPEKGQIWNAGFRMGMLEPGLPCRVIKRCSSDEWAVIIGLGERVAFFDMDHVNEYVDGYKNACGDKDWKFGGIGEAQLAADIPAAVAKNVLEAR